MQARNILEQLPSLVDISIPDDKHLTVCGDTHGQFYDLCNIFELNGLPSEDNPYLFNGMLEPICPVLLCVNAYDGLGSRQFRGLGRPDSASPAHLLPLKQKRDI